VDAQYDERVMVEQLMSLMMVDFPWQKCTKWLN